MLLRKTVARSLCFTRDAQGDIFGLVEFDEGGLGITRNDRPLAFYWTQDEIDAAVGTLWELSRRGRPEAPEP